MEGNAVDGGTIVPEKGEFGYRINVSATVLPPPTVSTASPTSGSITGGTKVVISGSSFAEIRSVSFGDAPAKGFTVNSEDKITALAPASKKPRKVPITVTTAAGTATSPTSFTYTACVVPKIKGKKLKASKKKLKKADCKIGMVRKLEGATAKTGKVVKQNPKPGKLLAPDSKVSVKLGG